MAILSMLANDASLSEISLIFLCDLNVHDICVNVISDSNSLLLFVNNVRVLLTGVAFRSSGDFIKDVTTLQRVGKMFYKQLCALNNTVSTEIKTKQISLNYD